ncbi:MAG: hypothetical protein IPK82_35785 [Polyangiaceae bacterium]|nr:hypothetical protein [Polyangiaceae bacterium]
MNAPWLVWDHPEPLGSYQGIRYVDLTLLPTPQAPTHATLIVHMLEGWSNAYTNASFSIVDGEGRPVTFNVAAQSIPAKTVTINLTPLDDQIRSHSDVVITLLQGGGPNIDAFFANAAFVFTIDCERGDCRPLVEKPPRRLAERPAIDLLTKDYNGFVALLSEWARVRNPAMGDLAAAALERVILELLAYQGDMLSYFQDRVANEAFVDTASQRHALRQHATLLGTHLFDGTAGETWLAFQASSDGYVPAGVQVTPIPGPENAEVVFYLAERTRVLAAHSELPFAAWPGAAAAVIPAGASEVLLWGRVENLRPDQPIAFVQTGAGGVVSFLRWSLLSR